MSVEVVQNRYCLRSLGTDCDESSSYRILNPPDYRPGAAPAAKTCAFRWLARRSSGYTGCVQGRTGHDRSARRIPRLVPGDAPVHRIRSPWVIA